MAVTHGTYDDGNLSEIKTQVEDALVQYWYRRLLQTMWDCDISLALAKAMYGDNTEQTEIEDS